jgi:hypothetical protein
MIVCLFSAAPDLILVSYYALPNRKTVVSTPNGDRFVDVGKRMPHMSTLLCATAASA